MWEDSFADGIRVSSRVEVPAPWLNGHVHVVQDMPEQVTPTFTGIDDAQQIILTTAVGTVREMSSGTPAYFDGLVTPGDVFVCSPEITADAWTTWSQGHSLISLVLPTPTVARAAAGLGLDYGALEFLDRFSIRDPVLEALAGTLAAEVEAGAPSGRLYAEEMLHAAAVHLVAKHTAEEPAVRAFTGGLPAASLRRVAALVHADLAADLALGDLAAAAGYSEWHFSRAFKASTGETPSGYVRRLRVEAGARLLRESSWGVASVAALVGYASPSPVRRRVPGALGCLALGLPASGRAPNDRTTTAKPGGGRTARRVWKGE